MSQDNPTFWIWISGALVTLWMSSVGVIFGIHVRKQNSLEKKIDNCYDKNILTFVPKTECVLMTRSIGRTLDDIKTVQKGHQIKLEQQGLTLASIDTKLDLIVENSNNRRKGDG